jgi:hypothetical protein
VWLQLDDSPGVDWQLTARLKDDLGFRFNFGEGRLGYVFVSADAADGRFLKPR